MFYRMKLTVMLAAMAVATTAMAQAPAAKVTRIRGAIVSLNGDAMMVHRNSGDTVSVSLPADVTLGAVKRIKLSDIKPGSFIGTAATTGVDGKMTATEVHVFDESARGTGEGHRAFDRARTGASARGAGVHLAAHLRGWYSRKDSPVCRRRTPNRGHQYRGLRNTVPGWRVVVQGLL